MSESSQSKELAKRLVVLEKNPLLRIASIALLILGPIALALAMAQVFPPGILGLHATLLGALIWVTQRKYNQRAKRKERDVRATAEGVFVDGKLVVPRGQIADGFFQPRPMTEKQKYGSSVRLLDKRRTILFEVELDETRALRFLEILGLDPASRRAEFRGGSPLFATLGRQFGTVFGAMGLGLLLGILGGAVHLNLGPLVPFLLIPLIGAAFLPSKITVGIDGILVRWLWTKRFLPLSDIRDVGIAADNALRVYLKSGREEVIYTSIRHKNANVDLMQTNRDAILARIREAQATFRARGTAVDAMALVARGTRSRSEWLSALEKLGRAGGGYRDAVVRSEDLLRVIEDPAAPVDARAGAALVLQSSADDDARARVRVAAEATASPKLRIALDAAAAGTEEKLRAAIDELANDGDDAHASARARVTTSG